MEYITLTRENLDREHICCALSREGDAQVASKKAWLAQRLEEGLVFRKAAQRGKCFIEYIPAEMAWVPIQAPGYLYIDCLWVSGSLKGKGYAGDLLDACVEDSRKKGKRGLCILSAQKKKPFLADPGFLTHRGFSLCDQADNGIQLWHLPFSQGETPPRLPGMRPAPPCGAARLCAVLHQPVPLQCQICPPGGPGRPGA